MKTSETVRGMQNLRLISGRGAMQHTENGHTWLTDDLADVIAALETVAEAAEEFKDLVADAYSNASVYEYDNLAKALAKLKALEQ